MRLTGLSLKTYNLTQIDMFDFEKLEVCKKSKQYNKFISAFLTHSKIDKVPDDQLR